jgi:hypothetical protein
MALLVVLCSFIPERKLLIVCVETLSLRTRQGFFVFCCTLIKKFSRYEKARQDRTTPYY